MRHVTALFPVVLFLFFAVAACETDTSQDDMGADTTGVMQEDTSAMMDHDAMGMADTVQVTISNDAIDIPASVPSGQMVFEITNSSADTEHSFRIENDSMMVEQALAMPLQPGETGTLMVDLQPGTYEIFSAADDTTAEAELTVTDM